MGNEALTLGQRKLRGTDSNSLLRMYGLVNDILLKSSFQQEREKADKAVQRIAKELHKRNVPL